MKLNPHHWRKFQQAQQNFLRALNMTAKIPELRNAVRWNGRRGCRKGRRRARYWGRQLHRWVNFITAAN